jgi:tripartite-type tricarboxylate transporter receptor subunit TctC
MITLFGAIVAGAGAVVGPAAHADPVADFYKGKTITMLTGTALGSAYGIHAQIFREYFSRNLPGNPNVIVQAMPGGGGAKMVNYLYNAAPQDGSFIGFPLKYLAVDQVLGRKGLKYDARKFGYIGTLGPINSAVVVWRDTSPALTLEDMKKKQVVMGATGRSSETFITPTLMNNLLGTRFRIVSGYKGMAGISLAIERGEVHGRAGSWDSLKSANANWLSDRKIVIFAQSGLERADDLKDVPTLIDLARDANARQVLEFFGNGNAVGWLMIAPPRVPAPRLAAMRAAFDKTVADAKYRSDLAKKKLDISPRPGAYVEKLIVSTVSVAPHLVTRIKQAMGTQ